MISRFVHMACRTYSNQFLNISKGTEDPVPIAITTTTRMMLSAGLPNEFLSPATHKDAPNKFAAQSIPVLGIWHHPPHQPKYLSSEIILFPIPLLSIQVP